MKLAENQKVFKQLNIDDTLWNDIKKDDNKVLIVYGSNGRGKSTIKDLFQKEKLEKKFGCESENQSNTIYNVFGNNKFLVFDEKFVDQFVYFNNSLQQNNMKIIMKTDYINELYNEKSHANDIVNMILDTTNKYLSVIESFNSILNIKSNTGTITIAKKRFATTFIEGNLPYKYDDLFEISDDNHRKWWYEGLLIYKDNKLDSCPWCKTNIDSVNGDLKEQIDSVDNTKRIDTKLFSDKVEKASNLSTIMNNTLVNEEVKNIISQLISEINVSVDQNVEEKILADMESLYSLLTNDNEIFNEIKTKVKILDNILEIQDIDLINNIDKLKFFSITEEVSELSNNLDYFIKYNKDIINGIKDSNKKLYEIIKSDEIDINNIIKSLGLKYYIEIETDPIVSSGINDNEKYMYLKSLNGNDVSQNIGNVLSFGEKSTLAFAIFIEQIRNSTDENTIIIFDDPISSYDIFRRYTSLGIIQTITALQYKKIVILTHESNFLTSIVSNYEHLTNVKCTILTELNESEIEIKELHRQYDSEVNVYKDMLNFSSNFHISQRIVALRQLHDLYQYITGDGKKELYDYICKLVHFRKGDNACWDPIMSTQINELFNYFAINYDSQIENIQDEQLVFSDMELLLNEITSKDIYDITLEDLVSLRMISEVAVRNESNDINKYKAKKLWSVKSSSKKERLQNFKVLLNSITHVDNDEITWPILCVNDLKSIPKYVISQIIDILK